MAESWVELWPVVAAGTAGALAGFLLGLKRGQFRNDRYTSKCTIEVLGGSLTALFLSPLVTMAKFDTVIGFILGLAWAPVIQALRNRITAIVEAALQGKYGGGQP
jgi:hypothetical protein